MKKSSIFKLILVMIALALSGTLEAQLSRNLHIGNNRNQAATNIRVLPDGSGTIIAGYDYDIDPVTGDVTNAQMVLLKVNPTETAILWERKFGVAGANNLIYNMIITHDGNIVVVGTMGRSSVYTNNIACIMKFDATSGVLIWQNNTRNSVHTVGGEIFYAVTELGAEGNYALVAVGSYDSRPTIVDAMIAMFENTTGTLIYNEVYAGSLGSSDSYYGICTAADGMTTYIVGSYNGDNYQSGMAHKYKPGMFAPGPYVPGTWIWQDFFDFTLPGLTVSYDPNGNQIITPGTLALNDNFFVDVYVKGNKVVILGGSLNDYTTTGGEGQSITRLDTGTGGSPENWQVQSSNKTYANTAKIFVLTNDHVISMQTPGNSWYDPIRWLTGTTSNLDVVVTDIPSLTAGTITTVPVKYISGTSAPALHSLLDMTLAGPDLYMAGVTNDSYFGFGQNDIYYVRTASSLPIDNGGTICDSIDTTGMLAVPMTQYYRTQARYNFVAETVPVGIDTLDYAIDTLCGKKNPIHIPCSKASWDGAHTTLTAVLSPADTSVCVYQVTATGTPYAPWTMIGYLWNIGGTLTWDPTSSGTDGQIVTIPYSGSQTITVTYFAIDPAGDTCTITRTITLNCQKPPCYDTAYTTLIIKNTGGGGTGKGMIAPNDSCTYTACVNVCTPYTIVGYDWTVSTSGTVTVHHTSLHTDCFTFTIPSGTTATVSVVAHIIDFNYADGTDPCCEAILTQTVTCGQIKPSPCADQVQSTLTWYGSSTANGWCYFTCTANVIPLPGWFIAGYSWSVNGGPFMPGGPTYITIAVPPGTAMTITVRTMLIDQKGDTCYYDMTINVVCPNDGGGGSRMPVKPSGTSTGNAIGTGNISIFPNPTNDAVTVSSTQPIISNIQVIDVNGKKLGEYNYNNSSSVNISLNNFPPGTYLLRVNNSTSKVVTKVK